MVLATQPQSEYSQFVELVGRLMPIRLENYKQNQMERRIREMAPDMEALEGVKKFPVRVKCATLAWTTLKNGLLSRRAGKETSETNEECAT